MPLEQARLNASWTAIAGQLFYNSDWLPDLPPERLDILKRTLLPHGLAARPVDLFEHDPPRIWLLSDTRGQPRRDVVALYNWDAAHAATIACPAARLGLPAAARYVAFDFWADRFLPPFGGQLVAELPPASCRILAVRPAAPQPQLLSTSRHVTQGMVDVLAERWDAPADTLRGVSRLVAGDPYQAAHCAVHGRRLLAGSGRHARRRRRRGRCQGRGRSKTARRCGPRSPAPSTGKWPGR